MAVRPTGAWLNRDLGRSPSLLLAGAIGAIYCFILLGCSALSNATPFWRLPVGLIGGALDIRNTLAGYWWFVQGEWRWPLLSITAANRPQGVNAERFDIIPVIALLGKVWHSFDRGAGTPYPLWVTACYTLNAAALAALVRSLGQRSWAAMLAAGAFGAMAPMVQARFGHLGLLADWLPVLALALYFDSRAQRLPWFGICTLCALSASVHLYLYVMTAAIATAIVLQATLDRRCSPSVGAACFAAILLAGVAVLWAIGILQEPGLGDVTGDYRRYSMNLLSPFWPQSSGLFRWTGIYWLTRGMISAVPGQYEGFSYLGAGGLLLLLIAVATGWRRVGGLLRRHIALTAVLVTLTAWALSDRIYLGPWLVLSYEAPSILTHSVLAWFRSCGRMFWPVAWLALACGVAGTASLARGRLALGLLVLAVSLQAIDVAPWRERFAALAEQPATSMFGSAENAVKVERMVRQAGAVVLRPQVGCSSDQWQYSSPLNAQALEVQLLAARANARMDQPYISRAVQNCAEADLLQGRRIGIFLHDPARPPSIPEDAACTVYGKATVCTIVR